MSVIAIAYTYTLWKFKSIPIRKLSHVHGTRERHTLRISGLFTPDNQLNTKNEWCCAYDSFASNYALFRAIWILFEYQQTITNYSLVGDKGIAATSPYMCVCTCFFLLADRRFYFLSHPMHVPVVCRNGSSEWRTREWKNSNYF